MYQVIKYHGDEEVSQVILYNESDIMTYCDHEFARDLCVNVNRVKDYSKREYFNTGFRVYLENSSYITSSYFVVLEIR